MAQSNSAHKVESTHLWILQHVFVERVTGTLCLDLKLVENESWDDSEPTIQPKIKPMNWVYKWSTQNKFTFKVGFNVFSKKNEMTFEIDINKI